MTLHAVTVLGHDRSGIIAQTTSILADLGLNIDDSTMTLLRGQFAMMLIVDGERTMTAVARGRVDTILIRRPLFRRMLDEFPDIAASLHRRLSANVRDTTSRLMTVRDRLDRLGN